MIQVYVTEMPKEETECPFFNKSNKKCHITDGKCCLITNPECEHLLTLKFFGENDD